jgi:flagellar protein FlaG
MEMSKLTPAEGVSAPRAREPQAAEADRGAAPDGAAAPAGGRRDLVREIEMIERMRRSLDAASKSRLLIDRDERGGQFIYKFMNPETGETVRQWPPERYLDLVAFLQDQRGGLIDKKA